MLRIWWRNCALCVIGNEFPCRQPHNPSATLFRGLSTLPKDKNRSPFHGEKPLMIKYFLGKKLNLPILNGRDAILRVRVKWLIFNMVLQLWADVKYHVPTGFWFFAEGERFLSFWRCHRPRKRAALVLWCG